MNMDISPLLLGWEYNPEKNVRVIKIADNRQVIQVRKPLGIEQYELEGRPDGQRPFGKGSALEEFQDRLNCYVQIQGSDDGFKITHNDFLLLQYEAVLNYYRYLVLFQIGDFERTVRDTDNNLKICDLIEHYSSKVKDKDKLLQYKPYILRINAIANAMINISHNMPDQAQNIIERAISQIQNLTEIKNMTFQYEKIRSINYLKATLEEINQKPLSPIDKLQLELEAAVKTEDYERAAEIRDKIHELTQSSDSK
jgi:hypothetical protein